MMPDLAFNLFSRPSLSGENSRNGFAFCFRVDKDPRIRTRLVRILRDAVESLPADEHLVFIAQVGRDVPFMREMANTAAETYPDRQVRFIDCHNDIQKAIQTYSECRVVISNRLHALLPALWGGAAPIALTVPELDPKISGVFESIGMQDRVLDVRRTEFASVQPLLLPPKFVGDVVASELSNFFDELLETVDNRMK